MHSGPPFFGVIEQSGLCQVTGNRLHENGYNVKNFFILALDIPTRPGVICMRFKVLKFNPQPATDPIWKRKRKNYDS